MSAKPLPQAQATSQSDVTAAEPGRWCTLLNSRRCGLVLALTSLAWLLIYVFWLAPYQEYLFSDMRGYWQRAIARLNGDVFSDSQFIAWPPFYHIVLAEFFALLRSFGLGSWIRLESALCLNIGLFTISVYAFQRLAVYWFSRPILVLLATLLYGFGFPAWYFNAFLLAGNFGVPLFIIALYLAVCGHTWRSVLVAALLFGAAAVVRPSLGPYGLAFVVLYMSRFGLWQKAFLWRAAVFSVAFFSVVGLASMEVSRISGGRVTGLSANGGLDFFIASTDYHRVDLAYDNWHYFIIVPAMSWRAEQGVLYTDVPFYEQSHYFDLGWEAISRRPARRVLIGLQYVRNLFFADMLPSRVDAPGFSFFRPVWDWFKLSMFFGAGLLLYRRSALQDKCSFLDFSVTAVGVTLVVAFFFTGEPRYTYEIIGIFYLLFLKLFDRFNCGWRQWRRDFLAYSAIVLGFLGAVYLLEESLRVSYPPTILVQAEKPLPAPLALSPRESLGLKPLAASASYCLGRLRFPFFREGTAMQHESLVQVAKDEPRRVRLRSILQLTGDQAEEISFRAFSQWPYSLFIDGQSYIESSGPDYFTDTTAHVALSPGEYVIEAVVDFKPHEGGFSINYSYKDEGWRVMRALGADSERVAFKLPVSAAADVLTADCK